MTRVADMLVTQPSNAAIDLAHRMRFLMGQDLDEFVIAAQIEDENDRLNRTAQDLLQEAWTVLTSTERSAWKQWITWRGLYERK